MISWHTTEGSEHNQFKEKKNQNHYTTDVVYHDEDPFGNVLFFLFNVNLSRMLFIFHV